MGNFKEKKELIILADVPPIPTEDRLIKYKEAGFNYYNLTEDYIVRDNPDKTISDEYMNAIDLCNKLGLKIILRTMNDGSIEYYDNVTDEFKGKVHGYYMTDEPAPTHLDWYCKWCVDDYVKLADWYNEHGGDTFFHINLLQDYGMSLLYRDPPKYEDYLDHYIETVLKRVKGEKSLGTDHYPMACIDGVNCIKPTAIRDYFRLAERTKKLISEGHDVRTGICIQLVSNEGLHIREIDSFEDVNFQVNLALCFGAKLLEYYIYANKGYANPGRAILCDMEQTVYTSCYDFVKKSNQSAIAFAKHMLKYEWVGSKTYVGTEVQDKVNLEAFSLCDGKEIAEFKLLSDFESTADSIVSEFNNNGETAYFAVNYTEPTLGVENTCTFTFDGVKSALIVKGEKQEKVALTNGKVTVLLSTGEGVFIIPEKA